MSHQKALGYEELREIVSQSCGTSPAISRDTSSLTLIFIHRRDEQLRPQVLKYDKRLTSSRSNFKIKNVNAGSKRLQSVFECPIL